VEPYNIYSQPGREPSRRFNSRVVLAVLVAVLAAAVTAAGLAFANKRSATVGTGVVVIETNLAYQGEQAAGTGMVLTSSGEVLTNNHVIRGATTIKVVVPSTGRSYNAAVVGYDASDDVAVLQASDAANLKTISLGDSSSIDAGESVQAIGNAGGSGRFTSASGTVTAVNRSITVSDDQGGSESLSGMIETNAAIRPGDSGGPLFNGSGQAIGMDTAASTGNDVAQTGTDGYAIPIDKALEIVNQIDDGNDSATVHVGATAFLGVNVTANEYGGSGATVSSVVSGGAAAAAGLAPGDVITALGGRSISSPADLGAIVASQTPGESVSVSYLDQNGMAETTNLTLATGPPR
jgi:S1-C subfamily serine protease